MSVQRSVGLGLVLAIIAMGKVARAEFATDPVPPRHAAPAPTVVPEPQPPKRWYGGTILAMDGLSYALITFAALDRSGAAFTAPLGAGMFLLSAPINHASRYRWGAAGASLGLRVGLTYAGLLAAGGLACDGDHCSSLPFVGFIALGMLTATAIDAAALAYEPVPPSLGVVPSLSISREHVVVGATGTF